MKHLKTYEDTTKEDYKVIFEKIKIYKGKLNVGDYFVYHNFRNKIYFIVKTIKINDDDTLEIMYAKYLSLEPKEWEKEFDKTLFNTNDHRIAHYYTTQLKKESILYKSTNIKDCVEYIEMIIQSKKYNL